MKHKDIANNTIQQALNGVEMPNSDKRNRNTPSSRGDKPGHAGGYRRIGRLRDAQDVQKFLAKMCKRIARGDGSTDAYKAAIAAGVLLRSVEVATLEKRIANLEKAAKNGNE